MASRLDAEDLVLIHLQRAISPRWLPAERGGPARICGHPILEE
jgi:hypothetical protein